MEYTPSELSGVLFYYQKDKDDHFKTDWEKTRIQTFFLISAQLTKKNKLTYEKFRRDMWPFHWEKQEHKEVDTESIMTIDQWADIFNKKIVSMEKVSANENIKI